MNKVKSSLAKLFLLGIASFIFLGNGFQPTPDQCEGVKGVLKVSIDSPVHSTYSGSYLEGTDLYFRVILDVEPVQSESFSITSVLRSTDFDNDRYSVSASHHRDMVSEDLFPSIRDVVAVVLETLNFVNGSDIIGYRAFECRFHQLTLEQQQVVLDIHIGDQVLPDFDFSPLILKAFEEEASKHGFELVQ